MSWILIWTPIEEETDPVPLFKICWCLKRDKMSHRPDETAHATLTLSRFYLDSVHCSWVKPIFSRHSKRTPKLVFTTDYRLLQVKKYCRTPMKSSLYPMGNILQYFRTPFSYHFPLKTCKLSNTNGTSHFDSLHGSYWADQKDSHNEMSLTSLRGNKVVSWRDILVVSPLLRSL